MPESNLFNSLRLRVYTVTHRNLASSICSTLIKDSKIIRRWAAIIFVCSQALVVPDNRLVVMYIWSPDSSACSDTERDWQQPFWALLTHIIKVFTSNLLSLGKGRGIDQDLVTRRYCKIELALWQGVPARNHQFIDKQSYTTP